MINVLDFANPSELRGTQIVEYIMTAEKEEDEDSFKPEECIIAEKEKDEDSFKSEECIIDDESGKVDFSYKRKAIQFWKDERRKKDPSRFN